MIRLVAALVLFAALVFAALFAAAALSPLSSVLPYASGLPVNVRGAQGTLLDGRLSGVALGPLPFGDVSVALRPASLLALRPRIALATIAPAPPLRADVALGLSTVAVDARGRLPLAGAFGQLPVGEVVFMGMRARFRDGRCEAAEGAVEAELAVAMDAIALPDRLGGTARCSGPDLLLPFRDGLGRAGLDLFLTGDGRWRAEVTLEPPGDDAGPALIAQGFRLQPDGRWRLTLRSR